MTDNLLILQGISIFSLIFSFFSCIFASFGLYYALKAWSANEAMRLSTHTVTYTPVDKEIEKANQDWATKQETIQKHQKMFEEDLEYEMPEFAPDEDDKQIFSF